jgi:NAD(P)H dehydrogenase (quinone)
MSGAPRILVLGANGTIGSAVVDELLAAGDVQVRAAIRRPELTAELTRRGAEPVLLDLAAVERRPLAAHTSLHEALRGVDALFLLTGYSSDMLVHSKAVIDAAREHGVGHVVHLGAWASTDTTIEHLGWHQLVEAYLERSGIPFTHLQPTTFMQNVAKLLLRPGGVVAHFIGDASVSWIDTRDIAAVAARVLRDPTSHVGARYGLGVESRTMAEVAATLSETLGIPFRAEAHSPDEFLATVIANGMEPLYARCVHNVFVRTADGSLPDAAAVFPLESLLGRAPITWAEHARRERAAFTTNS